MAKKTDNQAKPSYWAKLPAEVRYDNNLHPGAKVLYSEIDSLQRKKGYCWASNSYFSLAFKKSVNTISAWVKQLIDRGHITSRIDKSKANRRYLSTTPAATFKLMSVCDETIPKNGDSTTGDTIPKNCETLSPKTVRTIPKNCESYNRMNSNNEREERKDTSLPLDLEVIKNQIPETVTGRRLRASLDAAHLSLSSRFIEWFVIECIGRFTKSIGLTVPQLKDYESQVWEKFEGDSDLLTQALVKIVTANTTKGHIPSVKLIRGAARAIQTAVANNKTLVTPEKQQSDAPAYVPYSDRSDAELAEVMKSGTNFEKIKVGKIIIKRKEESATAKGKKLQAGGVR